MAPRSCQLVLVPIALLTACSEQHGVREISTVRISNEPVLGLGIDTAERFGFGQRAQPEPPSSPGFGWETPEGWEPLAPTRFRTVNFRVPGEVECYLTVLPGTAGGLLANVNRWRGQMGLLPWSDADVAALPRKPMLGQQAVFVDMTGEFQGMGGTESRQDSTLLGLVLVDRGMTLFVKMTGPDQAVRNEAPHLDQFVASLAWPSGATGGGAARSTTASAPTSRPAGGELQWTAPPHWKVGRDRTMRLVTLTPEGHEDTECYIVRLAGDGGGLLDNINRWRGQVGQPALDAAAVAALPAVTVLGQPRPLLEVTGDFAGMDGATRSGSGLLGVVCLLEGRSLFIKMVGPADVLRDEKAHFIAFCESLRF